MADSKDRDETTEALRDLAEHLKASLGKKIVSSGIDKRELCLVVKTSDLPKVMSFLRDDASCLFKQLMAICGADYPERPERFEVVYNLLSLKYNNRIRLKVVVDEETPVPSVTDIFSAAGWFEREVWDMYGVFFDGNPDLRRILTDYGFDGHPLRKDFPLTGFVELHYDAAQKRVVYAPVELKQDFRRFDFTSPWEGMTAMQLPGDEKACKPAFAFEEEITPVGEAQG